MFNSKLTYYITNPNSRFFMLISLVKKFTIRPFFFISNAFLY